MPACLPSHGPRTDRAPPDALLIPWTHSWTPWTFLADPQAVMPHASCSGIPLRAPSEDRVHLYNKNTTLCWHTNSSLDISQMFKKLAQNHTCFTIRFRHSWRKARPSEVEPGMPPSKPSSCRRAARLGSPVNPNIAPPAVFAQNLCGCREVTQPSVGPQRINTDTAAPEIQKNGRTVPSCMCKRNSWSEQPNRGKH